METYNLLEKYLKENTSKENINLEEYSINGSIIRLRYSYSFVYNSGEVNTLYDGELLIELLDYITWIYNSK